MKLRGAEDFQKFKFQLHAEFFIIKDSFGLHHTYYVLFVVSLYVEFCEIYIDRVVENKYLVYK